MAVQLDPNRIAGMLERSVSGAAAGPMRRGAGLRSALNANYLEPWEWPEQKQQTLGVTMAGKQTQTLAKKLGKLLDGPEDSIERLAFERDPQRIAEFAGIWRPKLQLIPDTLLKRMAIQDDLVAAVVHTRCNHVAQFGRQQQDRHQKGFKLVIDPAVEESLSKEDKQALQERIDRVERLLLTCGHQKGWNQQNRCSFTEFLYMSTRNAIVVGRAATEIIYVANPRNPRERLFHSFRPTDAGTIYYAAPFHDAVEAVRIQARRLLEQIKNEKLVPEKFENDEYSWVQVLDGRPTQAFSSEEMLVQNFYPLTDVELQGYPLTPLDTAICAVTTHINITNHNKLYFQHGRAARGMLVIKSQDVDAEVVQAVKQQFNASINAVHNCLVGSSTIITDQGQVTLEGFLDGAETRMTRLWTGTSWQPAMVYRVAEKKELCGLTLANGLSIGCSPAHRFWVINSDGEPVWRELKDIQEGDYVGVNKVEASNPDLVPQLNGKPLTSDIAEVLGWITGDGCIGDRSVQLFYHHKKERDIWKRHGKILRDFGISAVNRARAVSEEEKEKVKEAYGFKSVADERIWVEINDASFVESLLSIGFTRSSRSANGKSIPGFMYAAPSSLKSAFLRGLFSADGNNAKGTSPCITVVNDALRAQTRLLLMSMGIRTTLSEGVTKTAFVGGSQIRVAGKSVLRVKDRALFFEKVGFLQAHKQPRQPRGTNKYWGTSSSVPRQTVLKYLRMVKEATELPRGGNDHNVGLERVFTRRQQMDIDAVLRGEDSCSLPRLLNYMEVAGIQIPAWLANFNYEPVVDVRRNGPLTQMFDTTVYEPTHHCEQMDCKSDTHSLTVDGIYTHQSWRMPVFGINPEDDLQWVPIDQGSRDMEFQYLSDSNARTIMAAFQMSPEELPGYQHLSRGTNNQALSESQNEWKLTAARDVGIRPLLAKIEDFLNDSLVPIIDPEVSKYAKLRLIGLDIEDEEKESVRLQQDMAVHMDYDDVLQKVEKKPFGAAKGGKFPLNPAVGAIIEKYLTFGQILERFFDVEGAGDPQQHPEFAFFQNEAWMNWMQMQQAAQQQQMAAQQQQMAAQQQGAPGGAPPQGDGQPPPQQGGDLSAGVDQLQQLLGKSEQDPTVHQSRAKLRAHQRAVNNQIMNAWREEGAKLASDLADLGELHKPRRKS